MFEQKRIRGNCADVPLHSLKQKSYESEYISEAFSIRSEMAGSVSSSIRWVLTHRICGCTQWGSTCCNSWEGIWKGRKKTGSWASSVCFLLAYSEVLRWFCLPLFVSTPQSCAPSVPWVTPQKCVLLQSVLLSFNFITVVLLMTD